LRACAAAGLGLRRRDARACGVFPPLPHLFLTGYPHVKLPKPRYQEEIEEHNVTSVVKEMKETRIETECAQASAEAANIALGQSEGELLSPKQHFGDTSKELDTVTIYKKFRRSEDMNKRYEDNEEDPGHIQVATLVTS
jgi:hypothetical protein